MELGVSPATKAYEAYRRAREAREQAQAAMRQAQDVLDQAYNEETRAEVEWETLRREELEL